MNYARLVMRVARVAALPAALLALSSAPTFAAPTFTPGDLFVASNLGVPSPQLQWRSNSGALINTITLPPGGFSTGMGFDSAHNLYVTTFSGDSVAKVDPSGNFVNYFAAGIQTDPESIDFDAAGNAYVGLADPIVAGTMDLLKYDASGNLVQSYNLPAEDRGADWIDMAADQHIVFYTSEGKSVKRFDLATNTPLPDFATNLPGSTAFELKILPDQSVLLADTEVLVHLDALGNVIQTYTAPGENSWFALSLDPDGKSFWSGNFLTSNVYKLDIATGTILTTFNTGGDQFSLTGIGLFGEPRAAMRDVTPPTITGASADPNCLWPPNHKFHTVKINYTASDNVTPADKIVCKLSVSSNEPVNGLGDGNTSPDWKVIDAHTVELRAERSGTGSGRIYTITITCTDEAGNSATKTVTVCVMHDQGH